MLQRHQLEVDRLDSRPHHPILLQRRLICTVQLILRIAPLHVGHATQEEKQIRRSEDSLVDQDASCDRAIDGLEVDAPLEKPVPKSRTGPEHRFNQLSALCLQGVDGDVPPP